MPHRRRSSSSDEEDLEDRLYNTESMSDLRSWVDSIYEPSDSSSSTDSTTRTDQTTEPMAQLRRCLIEILGFTLMADFIDLNHALKPDLSSPMNTRNAHTILDIYETKELKCLAGILHRMHDHAVRKKWSAVSKCDRQKIRDAVLDPLKQANLQNISAYVLDILGTYTEHSCEPENRHLSMLIRHLIPPKKKPSRFKRFRASFNREKVQKKRMQEALQALEAHAYIIRVVSPNDGVLRVLEWGFRGYKERMPIDAPVAPCQRLEDDGTVCMRFPVEKGYQRVYEFLEYCV